MIEAANVRISMDGKGCCYDNIFIGRLWRTVKNKFLYLHAIEGGEELRRGLESWVGWYNKEHPHQGLNYQTPDEVYYKKLESLPEVA